MVIAPGPRNRALSSKPVTHGVSLGQWANEKGEPELSRSALGWRQQEEMGLGFQPLARLFVQHIFVCVNGQMVNIFNFVGHVQSLLHSLLFPSL